MQLGHKMKIFILNLITVLQFRSIFNLEAKPLQEFLLTFSEPNSRSLVEKKCLVRDNNLPIQQVKGVPCSDISSTSLNARWYWFPDKTIRGTNGYCLTYINAVLTETHQVLPPRLEAQTCKNDQSFIFEHWSNMNQRLVNHYHDVLLSNLTTVPFWITYTFKEEPFYKAIHRKLTPQSVSSKQEYPSARFTQAERHIPNEIRDLTKYESYLKISHEESVSVESLINDIGKLIDDIKHDVEGEPMHIGRGVSVEIMESPGSSPSASFLSSKFEVTPELLNGLAINPAGPLTLRVSGYLLAPKDDLYTFVVTDLGSQFRLTVNGETIINQWAAPLFGFVKSSPPLSARKGDELHIVASTSGVLGTPSFRLLWLLDSNQTPEEIPTENLFPSLLQPLCSSSFIRHIECTTTFTQIKNENFPRKVQCPPGCLALHREAIQIFGTPGCYALHSSICLAAIHSGVISERGGSILVEMDTFKERPYYPGWYVSFVQNIFLNNKTISVSGFIVQSHDAPASTGCGSIAMPVTDGGPIGLSSFNYVGLIDLLNLESRTPKKASGIVAIPTGSEVVLIAKRAPSSEYITSLRLRCESSTMDDDVSVASEEEIQLLPGVKLLYLISERESRNRIITNMFLTTNPNFSEPLSPSDEWNRLTCQTLNSTISLYFQTKDTSVEMPYSSATITCETTFAELKSPLPSFVVRCSRFCTKSILPVYGYQTYSARSSVCRAAIHAGILADGGGNVLVTRLPITAPITWNTLSNGVSSQRDESEGRLFHIDRPFGSVCIYPEHPGSIVHIPASSPRFEPSESFRQNLRKISLHRQIDIRNEEQNERSQSHETSPNDKASSKSSNSVEDFSRHAGSNELDELARSVQNKGFRIENYRRAIDAVESLIQEKLRDRESDILELENEIASDGVKFPADFFDYDKTDQIQDNWVIIDAQDAALGPSDWKLQQTSTGQLLKGLHQSSSISSNSNYGTFLLYSHSKYDVGFITARVNIAEQGHGTFGFVVKYKSDKEFIGLEISKPDNGGPSTISVHPMRKGEFGTRHNVVSYDLPSSAWVQLAADFGHKSVRFFVNDGQIKTGITLEEPNLGGFVGLFTRGLGSQSHLVWDNIICGPLWAQSVHHLEKAFGNDYERTEEISIPENAIEVDPVFSVIMATETELDNLSNSTSSFKAFNNASLLPIDSQTVENKDVQFERDVTGCLSRYSDPLTIMLQQFWFKLDASQDDTSWSSESDYFEGKAAKNNKPSYLILNQLICRRSYSTTMSLELRLKQDTRAGLIFRKEALTYYTAYLDTTDDTGSCVGLDEVTFDKTERYNTGTYRRIKPNVWYHLGVQDYGTLLKIFLNNDLILQVHSSDTTGDFGLAVLKGLAHFRSFVITQNKKPVINK